ncbi:hypothetical protein [Xanthomonas hortorum]|uniref:hypothetical protein n=1 Tax=Xanthomonas hortorum TaxID=56454 RepID=UPI001459953C|nr:hypothetical protein [Xanthomonas hortorum]MCE4354518.1 hypothetical protein [Xanthomonas hortorum pv. pelargonii]MCM5523453.1 hypothetical protein [Xanthomonas hortorum pv. pelargonii]MCM5535542.1 hypothetical protein [Xanthomonas hortorum pv. pelargonii]MCM5539188.1 hypothetical protein [Xanthomonas hortorum pv. pelargonii]MCM5545396.1 hypothetical protein [Xanthomonas hortorum pv. pelargonii]
MALTAIILVNRKILKELIDLSPLIPSANAASGAGGFSPRSAYIKNITNKHMEFTP